MTQKKLNADDMLNELKGQSVFFKGAENRLTPPPKKSASPNKDWPRTIKLPKSRTIEVTKSGTSDVPELQTYELRNFAALRRLDIRVTGDQKWFLEEMEEMIRQQMPEGESNNPESKRITKSAIIRVFVEIFRQLKLPINARKYQNEHDLMDGMFKSLLKKIPELRSTELPK